MDCEKSERLLKFNQFSSVFRLLKAQQTQSSCESKPIIEYFFSKILKDNVNENFNLLPYEQL